ncbi:hypothetical protein V6N13_115765 [Hibiscus sabdariffa]
MPEKSTIRNFSSNNSLPDCIRWRANSNGLFTVKSCCKISELGIATPDAVWSSIWSNLVPPSVEAFLWKAVHGRFPTKCKLDFMAKMVCDLGCISNSTRNEVVFKGIKVDVSQLFDLCIQRLSWWCVAKWPRSSLAINDLINSPSHFVDFAVEQVTISKDTWCPPLLGLDWSISHIPWARNSLADNLAKKGIARTNDYCCVASM